MRREFDSRIPLQLTSHMNQTNKPWDLLSSDQKRTITDQIIAYFDRERGEQVGIIAAEEILDIVLQSAGVGLYNQGVNHTRDFLRGRLEDLDIDIAALLKSE